jgi:hypothetical protein
VGWGAAAEDLHRLLLCCLYLCLVLNHAGLWHRAYEVMFLVLLLVAGLLLHERQPVVLRGHDLQQ